MPISTLPKAAMSLWESVYNASKKAGDKKEVAAQKAWASVKKGWRKGKDGKWTKKSEIAEISMYITKSTMRNGTMAWSAVNSDTDPDIYTERMSIELYKNFIGNIINEVPVPEEFKSSVCSDYWCGGMPYLSLSHYPDLNGEAVPGEPLEIYIDGNQLKAKGLLHNNPLGHAVWRSLKEDKNKQPDEKIRISIGFLDLAHKHGEDGELFVRDSLYSLCSECLQGIGDKIYVKGYLVHLALTRVPVNQRTEMVLEEKSMAKKKLTRKDDAASIVGEDLAEEVELKAKAVSRKSDSLIEMSETEEETAELIEQAEANAEQEVEEEVPAEDAPANDAEVPVEEPVEEKSEAEVKKFDDSTMDAAANEAPDYVENLPYGGATTMADAEKYMAAKNEAMYVMDMWSVFSQVAWNILERSDVGNKKEAMINAIDGFKNVLAVKAMVAFKSEAEPEPVVEHELQPALNELLEAVDASVGKSEAEIGEAVNPVLNKLIPAITDYLAKKSDTEQPVPNDKNIIDEIIPVII